MTGSLSDRLAATRVELTNAAQDVEELALREKSAAASASTYGKWREEIDLKRGEVARLSIVVSDLEAELESQSRKEKDAALKKRYTAKRRANEVLAKRIREDISKANAILLALIREVASSSMEDIAINASLPDDMEPLVGADHLARGRAGKPRQDIETHDELLWVKNGTQHLIGDQTAVRDLGNGRGIYETRMSTTHCHKALFKSVSFHPAENAEKAAPICNAFRLPHPDRPGFLWNGDHLTRLEECLSALDVDRDANSQRPVEIELIAVDKPLTNDERVP